MYIFANNIFRESIIFDFQTLISKWTELLIKKIFVNKVCSFKNTFSAVILSQEMTMLILVCWLIV